MSIAILFWGGCGLFAVGLFMGYLIGLEVDKDWRDYEK